MIDKDLAKMNLQYKNIYKFTFKIILIILMVFRKYIYEIEC